MAVAEFAARERRVDSTSRIVDQPLVLEVLVQCGIVGIQQSGVADLRQGDDVSIVGSARSALGQGCRQAVDHKVINVRTQNKR